MTSTPETKPTPTETKPIRRWEFHPLADLLPLLDAESVGFKALIEDIRVNKQHDPVILYEGKILDGRNRYRACQLIGIDVRTRDYADGDPIGFVLSVNLHRRHLNTSQRALVAAKLATFTHGGDRSKGPFGGLTDAAAAKLLSVSERSVTRARAVLRNGDPSAIEAVDKGDTTVTEAAAGKSGSGAGSGSGTGSKGGTGKGGKGTASASDKYDKAETKLIEKLKDLKPTEADAAATVTIRKLKATVDTMLKAAASAQAA